MSKLIVECPRCKREYTYTDIKDMENYLHWADTGEFKKVTALDNNTYMLCNDCSRLYKIFEGQTNNETKNKVKIFMQPNIQPNAQIPVTQSGIILQTSGIVQTSGQITSNYVIDISGQLLKLSGNSVKISGQAMNIGGYVIDISGQLITISGNVINIRGVISDQSLATSISGQSLATSEGPKIVGHATVRGNIVRTSG